MSFTLGQDGTPITKKDLAGCWGTLEYPKITAMYCDPATGDIYVAKKDPPISPAAYLYGGWVVSWDREYAVANIVKTFTDGTKVYVLHDYNNVNYANRMYVVPPSGSGYGMAKGGISLADTDNFTNIAYLNTNYSLAPPGAINVVVNPSPSPTPAPRMWGPSIENNRMQIPVIYVKTMADGTIIHTIQDHNFIKAVVRLPTGDIRSYYKVDDNITYLESLTISTNALSKWVVGGNNAYNVANPNFDTTTRVVIQQYNSQKQYVRDVWSGQSKFAINGICVRKGQIYFTHESQVKLVVPVGNPYRIAGTELYSGTRLSTPTAYARTFALGNPYGIAYDQTTDRIVFADAEHGAVYSIDVDTSILYNVCAGGTDIVSAVDDAERDAVTCYITDAAGIAVAADGTIYASSVTSGQIYKLRKDFDSIGNLKYFISIFAGYNSPTTSLASADARPGKYARILNPIHLAVDPDLKVYYYEQAAGFRIRYIEPDIYRTYFKGRTGAFSYWPLQVIMNNSPEGYTLEWPVSGNSTGAFPSIAFEFYSNHLAADEEGNVYFCDPKYGTLNRVTPNNQVQVIANIKNAYSLAILNNTDIWVCTLDIKNTSINSTLVRVPFIQDSNLPITPDSPISITGRIECMAAHPRGAIFMAAKDTSLYIYDIGQQGPRNIYSGIGQTTITSMCMGAKNSVLYFVSKNNQSVYGCPISYTNGLVQFGSMVMIAGNDSSPSLPLTNPYGVAYNRAENCLYITCATNDLTTPKVIRRVDLAANGLSGTFITTIIGSNKTGFPLSGASYNSVTLLHPTGIVCNLQGNIYFIDTMYANSENPSSLLVRVPNIFFPKPDVVYSFAGSGKQGTAHPADGTPCQKLDLNTITGITSDRDGNIYIATGWNTIIVVDALTYQIKRVAGNRSNAGTTARQDGVAALEQPLDTPRNLFYSKAGILYFIEGNYLRYLVRQADGTFLIRTLAGNGTTDYARGIQASRCNFGGIFAAMCVDDVTNILYVLVKNPWKLYMIDAFNSVTIMSDMVKQIGVNSDITTFGICKYKSNIFFSIPYANTIFKTDLTNAANYYDNTSRFISADGNAAWTDSQISYPVSLAVDKYGTMYVSMRDRHIIKRYNLTSLETNPPVSPLIDGTYIGTEGVQSYSDGNAISGIIDGKLRANTYLNAPSVLWLDTYNRLFYSEDTNNRICCVATGVDLDLRGISANYMKIESAGPGRTFKINKFDMYTLQDKVYDAIAAGDIANQSLVSIDIQTKKNVYTAPKGFQLSTFSTLSSGRMISIVSTLYAMSTFVSTPSALQTPITYINVQIDTADSIDAKIYLYNQFQEIVGLQRITADALTSQGQNLLFVEPWSQVNVPAIRPSLMNLTRGIQDIMSVGLIDIKDAIEKFIVVSVTENDQIVVNTQIANSNKLTETNANGTISIPILYYSSATPMEVLCVFLIRRPGAVDDMMIADIGGDYPIQITLKDSKGIEISRKKLVIPNPENSKYEVFDFRLNSELYSSLSMDAIHEAVFGVKRVRYVRIYFTEDESGPPTTSVSIKGIYVISVENGKNVAYGKPIYDSAANSYTNLTDESNSGLGAMRTAITWMEIDLQYPYMIDRVILNRADGDTTEYFIRGYTERREVVEFPGSAVNPYSQKTKSVYISGAGYNSTNIRQQYSFSDNGSLTLSGAKYNAMEKAYIAGKLPPSVISSTRIVLGKPVYTFSISQCSSLDTTSSYRTTSNFLVYNYTCNAFKVDLLVNYSLHIQKLLAYPTLVETGDTMLATNVTLQSSTSADANTTAAQALVDDTSHFITPERTNNAYWMATYTTPTFVKKFKLKQNPTDDLAKVRMFGIQLRHYNAKGRLLGRYGARGNYTEENFIYSQGSINPYHVPMLQFRRGVPNVRYVRMITTDRSTLKILSVSQIAVYDTQGNLVSLNKPVTISEAAPYNFGTTISNDPSWITQGHLFPGSYKIYHNSNYIPTSYIQIDLSIDFTGEIESVVYYNRCGNLSNYDQDIGTDLTYRSAGQQIQLLDTNQTLIKGRTLKGGLLRENLDFRDAANNADSYVRARYVRIENPGPITSGTYTPSTMVLNFFKVIDVFRTNVVYGKVVTAVNMDRVPGTGEYGPIKTAPAPYTIAAEPGSYWEIDLGEEISIKSVEFQTNAASAAAFTNAPLNFYDEDRSLIKQYFLPKNSSARYTISILNATNPTISPYDSVPLRFVQILGAKFSSGVTPKLKLGQVVVLDKYGQNIALGKPCYSSQYFTRDGIQRRTYYPINGKCDTYFMCDPQSPNDSASTPNSGDQYWELDLGGTYNVSTIILKDYENVSAIKTFKDTDSSNPSAGRIYLPDLSTTSIPVGATFRISAGSRSAQIEPVPRTGVGKKARYVRLRKPPIANASNNGENCICLSQIVVMDAAGRNVAIGKTFSSYPDTGATNVLINGFYEADGWPWASSKYSTTTNPFNSNSLFSIGNWNTGSWNTSLDTGWFEIDLGAEYWITDIIIHDLFNNEWPGAKNYDLILRDTYYNMTYYGPAVFNGLSRTRNIMHRRVAKTDMSCPSEYREFGGTCYENCSVSDVIAGDIPGTGTAGKTTTQTQCYGTCAGNNSDPNYDSVTRTYSTCSVCPANSQYDPSLNKCVSACLPGYEPQYGTSKDTCVRTCGQDPSGAPMYWVNGGTTECRTQYFDNAFGLSAQIRPSSDIAGKNFWELLTIFTQQTSSYGTAIIKSAADYSAAFFSGKLGLVYPANLKTLQDSGRARLMFRYFYDDNNGDGKTSFNGVVPRVKTDKTNQSRGTIPKKWTAMNLTAGTGYILNIGDPSIPSIGGTSRAYEIYLDWCVRSATKRFYVDDRALNVTNVFMIYGRSFSQTINFIDGSKIAEAFTAVDTPQEVGVCPSGYTDTGRGGLEPCKQNMQSGYEEIGGKYYPVCPQNYTRMTTNLDRCIETYRAGYEIDPDSGTGADKPGFRTPAPTSAYVKTTSNSHWILCSGNDPEGNPYSYQNNAGLMVFNSQCYQEKNNVSPRIPNGGAGWWDTCPFDQGLWNWFTNQSNQWLINWMAYGKGDKFSTGGCDNKCVTSFPPNGSQSDIKPYVVVNNTGDMWQNFFAWASDSVVLANQVVNGTSYMSYPIHGEVTTNVYTTRNLLNNGWYSYFYNNLKNNGLARRIYVKGSDNYLFIDRQTRNTTDSVGITIDYEPKI